MIARSLQIFFATFLGVLANEAAGGELRPGQLHALVFRDVDGNDLSTKDGHVMIVTVVTRESEAKARAIAEQVPERYVGDAKYRYVTVVNFQGSLLRPLHGLTRALIRGRLDAEAKKLRPRYTAKKITRDPRQDVYVVADFDGAAVTRLGLSAQSNEVAVFVFAPRGKLVARWNDVPPAGALPRAIIAAE